MKIENMQVDSGIKHIDLNTAAINYLGGNPIIIPREHMYDPNVVKAFANASGLIAVPANSPLGESLIGIAPTFEELFPSFAQKKNQIIIDYSSLKNQEPINYSTQPEHMLTDNMPDLSHPRKIGIMPDHIPLEVRLTDDNNIFNNNQNESPQIVYTQEKNEPIRIELGSLKPSEIKVNLDNTTNPQEQPILMPVQYARNKNYATNSIGNMSWYDQIRIPAEYRGYGAGGYNGRRLNFGGGNSPRY